MLYQRIITEHNRLSQEAHSIRQQLSSLPDGKLVCTSGNGYVKWYQSDGHTPIYIPKKNRALAEQLAYKKYLSLRLESIEKELQALDYYLRHHNPQTGQLSLSLLTSPGYSDLLSSHFSPLSLELTDWMNAPFEGNPLYPEGLIHSAPNGLFVRSKSEALIALQLHTHHVPFRYEAPLTLGDATYYPDFTIRHPTTGEFYYWEHFGLMDDSRYCQRATSKLKQYIENGIIPTFQLITTYETKQHPLSAETVNHHIESYFL